MSWRLLLLGLLAFALALLVVLPARWINGLLPAGVSCAEWSGTLWRGHCRRLTVTPRAEAPVTLESANWTLHPLPLLRGRVTAEVVVTDTRGDASGHVEYARSGLLVLRDVSAHARFDPRFSVLPAGWRGRVEIEQFELDWQANQLRHLQGEFRFFDLRDEKGQEFGNYRVNFPPATDPPFKGQLADAGGPLELSGGLELTADRHWTLNGKVAPRAGSDSGIIRNLEMLGGPDSAGRYPLSVTGGFN